MKGLLRSKLIFTLVVVVLLVIVLVSSFIGQGLFVHAASPPKGTGTASSRAKAATNTPLSQFTVQTLSGGTKVVVYDGDLLLNNSTETTVLGGFTVHAGDVAKTTWVVGDGQCGTVTTIPLPCKGGRPTAGSGDTAGFTGGKGSLTIGPDAFRGSDPCPWGPDTCLWDTRSADVTNSVSPGDTSVTASVTSGDAGDGIDCINHIAQVFSTGPKTAASSEGYVAAGVGLRNQGSGNITLTGIPAGAHVVQALLYWTILNPSNPGGGMSVNGNSINSTLVSGDQADPCWGAGTTWAFRSDVTTQVASVGGNGTYTLSGYPTGSTSGGNPWDNPSPVPMAEGASLVVIYQSIQNCANPQPGPGPFNICVNTNSHDAKNTQSETSVAVSSVNSPGTTVMVGYNDIYNSEITGYSVSYDGGTRWRDMGTLPHPSNWSNGGDPVLTVDKNGVFYFAQIAYKLRSSGNADQIISLSKCTDSPKTGIKCGMPVQVSDAVPYNCVLFFCDNDKTGNDKPGIVYDPVSNRVYVTWTHFGYKTTKTNIIKLRSYNVSAGKLDPKTYDLYIAGAGSMNGSYPVVTSDGLVHVFFETGLNTQTNRHINYVKFKNGTISHLFTLAPVTPAGSLTPGCGTNALHTQAFSNATAARTIEFPTAAVDKSGNIDVVWNANLPSGLGPAVSVIWVATLISKTDKANFQSLSISDKFDTAGTLLIQWQPTVAVAGKTQTVVVTYFQVVQLANGTYWIERDMVRAPAGTKPTFGLPSLISTQLWQPDKTNPNFNPPAANCYMGDYDGSVSTPTANVVWVYWGDSRDYTTGIGPQPDVWGLTIK